MRITSTNALALVALILLCAAAWFSFVDADTVAIDTSVNTSSAVLFGRHTVFISPTTGYFFYTDSGGTCVYSKTTNRGISWGAAVTVDSQTDCRQIDVWYDRWTPGDTSGTYVHIATVDSGSSDVWYTRLDTSSDTQTTTLNVTGANQGGSYGNYIGLPTITKGTDGTIYIGISDNADSFVIECSSSCDSNISQWTETGTNPLDLADSDTQMLVPLASGNILLINHDISGNVIRSKVWNNSAWDVSWTDIETSVEDRGASYPMFSAVADINNPGTVYLAYLDDTGTLGTDDDINTATYSGSSWTAKTDVLTDTGIASYGIEGVSIGISDGKIYVVFGYSTSPLTAYNNIYWKYSSDGMTTWSGIIGPIWETTDERSYYPNIPAVAVNGSPLYATFYYAGGSDSYRGGQIGLSVPTDDASYVKLTGNVKFLRNIAVVNSLTKSSGTFVIDHPQKPRTHLLYHSFVESPDVKNIYDGIVTLDSSGEAIIRLPHYFEALNKDFRYQFFPLKEAMPNLYIKEKVEDNQFVIAGGVPGGTVSWQITGIRHDPYIQANPIEVEMMKGPNELVDRGECIFAPLCQ